MRQTLKTEECKNEIFAQGEGALVTLTLPPGFAKGLFKTKMGQNETGLSSMLAEKPNFWFASGQGGVRSAPHPVQKLHFCTPSVPNLMALTRSMVTRKN